jgi:hypothetical protein
MGEAVRLFALVILSCVCACGTDERNREGSYQFDSTNSEMPKMDMSGSISRDDGGTIPLQPPSGSQLTREACEIHCLQALICETSVTCVFSVRASLIQNCRHVCEPVERRGAFEGIEALGCPEAGVRALGASGLADACVGIPNECEVTLGGCESGHECVMTVCRAYACENDSLETQAGGLMEAPHVLDRGDQSLQRLSICDGDVDTFEFEIPANQNVFINLGFAHRIGDLDMEIVMDDVDGHQVVVADSGDDNESIVIQPASSVRKALLEIYGFSGGSNRYDLYVTFQVPLDVCETRSDCSMGFGCVDSLCTALPPCTLDSECGLGVCDIGSGRCHDCLLDRDCLTSEVCTENACVECRDDDGCPGRLRCSLEGLCEECLADTDCTDGTCQAYICRPEACNDVFEPNDSLGNARRIQAGSMVAGAQHCGDDDYFVVNIPPRISALVEVSFLLDEGDLDLEVSDPSGALFRGALRTDGERIGIPAGDGGDYLIRVFKNASNAQSYGLRIQLDPPFDPCSLDEHCVGEQSCDRPTARCRDPGYCAENRDCDLEEPVCDPDGHVCGPCEADNYEPNDHLAEAIPIALVEMGHLLNTCGGSDFFSFETSVGQSLTIELLFDHEVGDLDMRVYDPSGEVVERSVSVSDDEIVPFLPQLNGVFIVEVYGFGGVYNGYGLNVRPD